MICTYCRAKDVTHGEHQDDCFRGAEEHGHKFDVAPSQPGTFPMVECVNCGFKQLRVNWNRGEPEDIPECPGADQT